MSRSRRFTVLGALFVVGTIVGACAGKGPGRCPKQQWCGSQAAAGSVAESLAGDTFTCPIDLNTGVAIEAGQKPPEGLPIDKRVTLDEKATRAREKAGESDVCCYSWSDCEG
jgi:hypothetical protein